MLPTQKRTKSGHENKYKNWHLSFVRWSAHSEQEWRKEILVCKFMLKSCKLNYLCNWLHIFTRIKSDIP